MLSGGVAGQQIAQRERPPLRETSGTSVVIQRSLWENFKVVEMIQH